MDEQIWRVKPAFNSGVDRFKIDYYEHDDGWEPLAIEPQTQRQLAQLVEQLVPFLDTDAFQAVHDAVMAQGELLT